MSTYSQLAEQSAEQLVNRLSRETRDPSSVWQASAKWSSTRIGYLLLVKQKAENGSNLRAIVVSPPAGEMDAGAAALLQLGVGLAQAGEGHRLTDRPTDPARHWQDKVDAVEEALAARRDSVVLLCDDHHAVGPRTPGRGAFRRAGR